MTTGREEQDLRDDVALLRREKWSRRSRWLRENKGWAIFFGIYLAAVAGILIAWEEMRSPLGILVLSVFGVMGFLRAYLRAARRDGDL